MMVSIVGSSTGEAKRKTMTIENGIFFFSILTTTGIVEQEQKGVIKANRMAAKLANTLLLPVNFFSIFSYGMYPCSRLIKNEIPMNRTVNSRAIQKKLFK